MVMRGGGLRVMPLAYLGDDSADDQQPLDQNDFMPNK